MIKFKSLTNESIGYAWQYDYSYGSERGIDSYAKQYDTYGDGMTQHSPMYSIGLERMQDFLVSFAAHLQVNMTLLDDFSGWPTDIGVTDIEFYRLQVIFSEKKTRYYSAQLGKVSASESKRHDKRWEEIPNFADGSFDATYRLLRKDYYSPLHRLALLCQVRDHFGAQTGSWPWIDMQDYGFGDWSYQALRDAFEAVNLLVKAAWSLRLSTRMVANYLRNVENDKLTQEQAA